MSHRLFKKRLLILRKELIENALVVWHRGAAWILGPLLLGLLACALTVGADYAGDLQRGLFARWKYLPLLLVPGGFMLLRYFADRFFPGTQGSGIPQTIAAIEAEYPHDIRKLLSLRIVTGKMLMLLGALACGASSGREGPTVQIGASIMHSFFGRGPFRNETIRRTLILAGGAGGIAAAFNTPLAGIMFAIEELSKKHPFNASSSTLMSVIVSGLISLALLGNYTYFGTTAAYLGWDSGLIAIAVCALTGGIGGGVFSRLLTSGTDHLPASVAAFIGQRRVLFAGLCGLLIATIGILTGQMIFGTGYQATRASLENSAVLPWHFGIAKLLATLLSSLSEIPGGLFAPSLAVGAGFGDNIAALLPDMASHSAIVLLTMAAYLSGVTRAPLTSFIIMMEMTNSHEMLLPLMMVAVIASRISKFICRPALYHCLAERLRP